ncbi:MAG: histidine kinase [Lachnospiraceae bacterium]|nr:histidine kinase [Lachnospiraceae bacterium]
MKKSHSVQATLQIAFFSILIVIFLVYISYFVVTESGKIQQQAYNTIHQDVSTAAAFVDAEINSLDTVMQNIAYSNLVKEQFSIYLNQPISSEKGNYSGMQNSKILTNLLTAIMGPNRPVDQIYLYSLDYGAFGNGLDNSSSDESVQNFYWYEDLMNSEGNRIIFCDDDKRLDKYYSYKDGSRFLTLCSVYQSTFYKPEGIIEVKRSISPLIEKLKVLESKNYEEQIYIFDTEGIPVYATSDSDNISHYFSIASDALNTLPSDEIAKISEKDTKIFFSKSAYSGFITLITVSDSNLYKPIFSYLKANLVIFLIVTLLALALSYVVSRIITNPLMKMYSQLQSLHTESDASDLEITIEPVDTSIIELDTLYNALIDMHGRAQTAMKREMAMHNQELQSHMLALQSQMNPHFLYNSLATIQAMADEGMKDEVIEMCQTISRILRYISSNKEPLVPIREDIAHAKDYLECMRMRYDDDLTYEIDIPEEMMELQIPKLCLQLIIENSIKFSTKSVRPPWHIKIKGILSPIFWEISIQDNGIGFAQETIDDLNEKIAYINETELLPSLEINGMGLMNIYIRFKTLYKGKHIFRISNLASGGAIVTIGGDIEQGDMA